jgi:photosystem II stability/assembly factor-like uncharacterized protein
MTTPDTGYRDIYEAYFINDNVGILCGYSGLIMKTTDAGKTWVEKNSGVSTNLWYVDFVTPDTGYIVGTSATILKTTDGGETWVNKSLTGTTSGISKVHFINPSTGYIGTANSTLGYVCKTTDYGNTWNKVTSYPGTGTVYGLCFTDINNGYASDNTCTMYKTTDGGATWTSSGKLSSGTLYEIRFADANNGAVCGSRGEVFVTTNAGAVWTKTNNPYNTSLYALGMQLPSKRLVTVGNGGVMSTSTDFGATWNMLSVSTTVQLMKRIQFVNSNTGFAVGGSAVASDSLGEVLKTTNGGSTWTKLAFNPKTRSNSLFWLNENVGWVGGIGTSGIFKTTDGGQTFKAGTVTGTSASTTWYDIKFGDANTGYAGGTGGILVKTTDGGANWVTLVSPFGTTIIYAMQAIDANTVVVVGGSGKAFKTTDGGTNWTTLSLGGSTSSLYSVTFTDKNLGVISGGSSSLFKTTDGGNTWSQLTLGVSSSLYCARFQDQNIGWACGSSGVIAYTKNGGATWTKTKSFMSSSTLYDIAIVGGYVWITNEGGAIIRNFSNPDVIPVELTSFSAALFGNSVKLTWKTATETNNKGYSVERKADNSAMWESVGFVNGKGTSAKTSEYSFTDVPEVAASYSYRLKQIDFDGAFDYSGIVEVNMTAPQSFALSQNYPNPFNPSTTINYSIPMTSKVSLKIFDMLGREVASLVNETKQAGNYEVVFNASKISSGVYFYKLQAGSFTETKKLTLMK